MIDFFIKKIKNESGMALTASTMFIFVVLSIMAFYLARFSILNSESAGNYVSSIRARNLAQTGLEVGLRNVEDSYSSLQSSISGSLNRGSFSVKVYDNKDETNSDLLYQHYSLLESESEIGGVQRSMRLLISSYPDAFNLAFYGENIGNSFFSTLASINGDIYFNGDFEISNQSSGFAYSSLENPSNGGVFHGAPLVEFPSLDNSYYEDLLETVSGSYGSGGGNSPALYFDGSNDYASIKNMHYDQKGEIPNLTVSAWVKLPSNGGGWSVVDFDRSEYYTCAVGIANGNVTAEGDRVAFHTAAENSYIHDMWGNTSIRDGEWHHVVWVYNSSEVNEKKIYVDGELDKEMSAYPTNERLGYQGRARRYGFLGDGSEAGSYNSNRNNQYYRGYMDEVSIWHKSFPANEISLLENVSDVLVTRPLQAYWKMDEGSGTTLVDSHGDNDAILRNGVSWQTREGSGGAQGVVLNETINLSEFTNNILINDELLTLDNCVVNGPGVIMTSGNLTISGNTTIGPGITLIAGGNLSVSGNVTIGSSIENYSVIYCKNNLSVNGNTTFYGVLIGRGQSSSTIQNSNLYGAIYLESQNVSIVSAAISGSLVSKYAPSINASSTLNKSSLPDIFGTNIGFQPSVIPGSYLEY